jgi:hypothetical protein
MDRKGTKEGYIFFTQLKASCAIPLKNNQVKHIDYKIDEYATPPYLALNTARNSCHCLCFWESLQVPIGCLGVNLSRIAVYHSFFCNTKTVKIAGQGQKTHFVPPLFSIISLCVLLYLFENQALA